MITFKLILAEFKQNLETGGSKLYIYIYIYIMARSGDSFEPLALR